MVSPLRSPELTKRARERLGPTLAAWGFRRTPKATPASWCRPEGDEWLVFWFQPSTSNGPESAGFRFTLEFLLGSKPEIYGNGVRKRFPTLLTDEGREHLRRLENQTIARLPPPDPALLSILDPTTRAHVLKGWQPRSTPYGVDEDVWMRQINVVDVDALLNFILAELPGVLERFLAAARAGRV